MRLLCTSDTQAEFANLDVCEVAFQELKVWADEYKPDAIIHAGDLKESYNPLDLRIAKWWLKWLKEITGEYRFIALLGNHDRLSQSEDAQNWLDILRAGGAETVSTPRAKKVGDGTVYFLPFMAQQIDQVGALKELAEAAVGSEGPKALVFHIEVRGARLNMMGAKTGGLPLKNLRASAYDVCLGGHIHLHQRLVKTVYYIGSPFCDDWNDVNQRKGCMLVDIYPEYYKLKRLITKIPHWYDRQWIEERDIKPEPGAYIRSRVAVTSKKITQRLDEEEENLKKLYGNKVRLFVVPKLLNEAEAELSLEGATDREKIEEYVAATIPTNARFPAVQAIQYMKSIITTATTRGIGRLEFLTVEAENVLTYKKVAVDYRSRGLVLVRGENHDWPRQSNGAGKSNLLSLLIVAMFGQTMKKQRADEWANERTKGRARISLRLRDGAGRKIKVIRTRPHSLTLLVNGDNKSSGIRGTGKQETQGLIEKTVGFDLKMLLNAVYIDQTIANGFLFGGQKDRMDLMNSFLDLDRFEAALKLVGKDIDTNVEAQAGEANLQQSLGQDILTFEDELDELGKQVETNWSERLASATKRIRTLVNEHVILMAGKDLYEQTQRQVDELSKDEAGITKSLRAVEGTIQADEEQVDKAKALIDEGLCWVCEQPSAKVGKKLLPKYEKVLAGALKRREEYEESMKRLEKKIDLLQSDVASWKERLDEKEQELERAREELALIEQGAKEEAARNQKRKTRSESLRLSIQAKKRLVKMSQETQHKLSITQEMLEYSKKAFSRLGIPMYISASLCPALNRAAEEYSEIFNDGKIGVTFSILDGQFDVSVVNPSGSEKTAGQSVGESAMAGIVTAFALREAAPKTNLLILDEPGHGLDPEACKRFARGLLRLKKRFGTILVTTHSPYIDSVLSGEKVWTVVKKNGVSHLHVL